MNKELQQYIMLFLAGTIPSVIRFLNLDKRNMRYFLIEILMGISVAFFIAPAMIEYYKLNIKTGCGITWVLAMFSEQMLRFFKKKLININKDDNGIIN
jgi:hypothetical protein